MAARVIAAASVAALSSGCGGSTPTTASVSAVVVVQTNVNLSQRLTRLSPLHFGTTVPRSVPVIRVDDGIRYQTISGVGAAMTDTSAWLIDRQLPAAARATVMAKLFGAGGIRLGYVRVPIGASDFTRNGRPYSYDDLPPGATDPSLSRFSVAHDDAYIVPILRQMLALNPAVRVLASPWSPPAWMKSNALLGNPHNTGRLLRSAYDPLARYFVKFIEAYRSRGIPVAAVTAQNEPGQQSGYPGMNLPEPDELRFIAHYLAPALRAAGLTTRVYGHDFKWLLSPRAQALASSASGAMSGVAWHCYDGNPTVMAQTHLVHPGLDQIETECSSGIAPGPPAELMIASFRNWATAVVLWNLALDPSGGPVQPPNHGCTGCIGVVTVDERTHTVRYGSDYYQLGQLSSFVQPGARRIESNSFVTYNTPTRYDRVNYAKPGLDDVAFVNPDGGLVLMAHNNAADSRPFAVSWRGRSFGYTLPASATVTFTWR